MNIRYNYHGEALCGEKNHHSSFSPLTTNYIPQWNLERGAKVWCHGN